MSVEKSKEIRIEANKNNARILRTAVNDITTALSAYIQPSFGLMPDEVDAIRSYVQEMYMEDLKALHERDKAALTINEISSRNTMKSILNYRISHALYYFAEYFHDTSNKHDNEQSFYIFLKQIAIDIYERTKREYKIEIHPGAVIGKRFSIDHGTNTVIGQQVTIGNDCYILNNVVIGARNIGQNSMQDTSRKRHPTIGNNVTIAAGTRILGNIDIGANVNISPGCLIDFNIPFGNVSIVNQVQIRTKINSEEKVIIYGVVPDKNLLAIYGENLQKAIRIYIIVYDKDITEIDEDSEIFESTHTRVLTPKKILVEFDTRSMEIIKSKLKKSICIEFKDQKIYIMNSIAVDRLEVN